MGTLRKRISRINLIYSHFSIEVSFLVNSIPNLQVTLKEVTPNLFLQKLSFDSLQALNLNSTIIGDTETSRPHKRDPRIGGGRRRGISMKLVSIKGRPKIVATSVPFIDHRRYVGIDMQIVADDAVR